MKVFISGIDGNMGRRYRAIFTSLGHTVIGADREASYIDQAYFVTNKNIDRIVIATPTESHLDAINIFGGAVGRPMLCEKPIAKSGLVDGHNPLTMINQYEYLVDKDCIGPTYFDYWNTGKDGLHWDCINIIGLAKNRVELSNVSPTWQCQINGQRLSIADMDGAYIQMCHDWIQDPKYNHKYIEHCHSRVLELLESVDKPHEKKKKKNKLNAKSAVVSRLNHD